MKIAYVTTYDARDEEKSWGLGTVYYMAETLKRKCSGFEYIGPLKRSFYSRLFTKSKKEIYNRLYKKKYMGDREPALLKHYAKQVSRCLAHIDCDIVFSPGTIPIAYLQTDKPVVFWTDGAFAAAVDYYPDYSNLCADTIKNGNKMEKAALERCALGIYSSEWAAVSAVQHYGIEKSKIKVVPYGANLDFTPTLDEISKIIDSRSRKSCNLLFLAVEWDRKGGDTAFQVAQELNKRGLSTQLTIVGCDPPAQLENSEFMRTYGFLRKSVPAERDTFYKVMRQSHFLILPTKADCAPSVFREANALGVPCVTTDTGGIPSIISNELNGKTFSLTSTIDEYCDYIISIMADYEKYRRLAFASFNEYETRFTWDVVGESVKRLLMSL